MDLSPGSDQGRLEEGPWTRVPALTRAGSNRGRGLLCPGVRTLRLEAGRCLGKSWLTCSSFIHLCFILQRSAEQLNWTTPSPPPSRAGAGQGAGWT